MYMKLKIWILIAIAAGQCLLADAQISNKEIRKACKTTIKTLKKEGWKVAGSKQTIDVAVTKYYQKWEAGGTGLEMVVGSGEASDINLARSKARTHANKRLAEGKGININSVNEMQIGNATNDNGETETSSNMQTRTVAQSNQRLQGVSPVLEIYRTKTVDGKEMNEFRLYYLISSEEANN